MTCSTLARVQNVYFVHGLPIVPERGRNPLNTLKNCAETAAKINVQEVIPIDELRPFGGAIWNFTHFVLDPHLSFPLPDL
jgi:hypothetical protein